MELEWERFNSLPLDIQREIFFDSGADLTTREYYDMTEHQRELRCNRDISYHEIMKALGDPNITGNVMTFAVISSSNHTLRYANTIPCKHKLVVRGSINGAYTFGGGSYTNQIINIDENNFSVRIKSNVRNVDDEHPYKYTQIYHFGRILLAPSFLYQMLDRRGSLCIKHQKNVIVRYIKSVYDRLYDTDNILLLGWLIMCINDMNIIVEDIKDIKNATINYTSESIKDYINTFYDLTIDNI